MNKNTKINNKKIIKIKKNNTNNNLQFEFNSLLNIIQETILSIQKYKTLDVISSNNLYNATNKLENLFSELMVLNGNFNKKNVKDITLKLNKIKNELGNLISHFGTDKLENLLNIRLGDKYIEQEKLTNNPKYNILKKYAHPISCSHMKWKNDKIKHKLIAKNRIVEDYMIVENSKTLECFDLARTSSNFQTKVYGIKISFQNPNTQHTLIVKAIIDDLNVNCIKNSFITDKLENLIKNKPADKLYQSDDFHRFVQSLTLKELLIYNENELYHKYSGYINQHKLFKSKTVSNLIKDFINSELYKQRTIICQILVKSKDPEFQYLAYLLYDLLSNENNGNVDTQEQTILYDSFPWNIKKFFRDAMTSTIKYTKTLTNFDTNNIPIEQQICMMKASDSVKEKAMIKLKEVKAKSEDSGSKARQYLDGLLKIPFGIYKSEQLLNSMKNVAINYQEILKYINKYDIENIEYDENISNIEILKQCSEIKNKHIEKYNKYNIQQLINVYTNNRRDTLVSNVCYINNVLKKNNIKNYRLCHSGKKNQYMKDKIIDCINKYKNNDYILDQIKNKYIDSYPYLDTKKITDDITDIFDSWNNVNTSIQKVNDTLDTAVHGHKEAKRQVERIIGQWVTGKQSGYCFGFEGPPGCGKTTLARKGLADCLKDDDGTPRPFAFIALGGASNGSTLSGHNYTYVGSTWGKIVDVLMQTKCMNPIIFIDELDKISNTEHGKEIVGILTHLVDSTQNSAFQDKYFSGIDLDLSKVLFIFSYNNPQLIDKILLDRIHRIKFNHLSLEDKLVISREFILPEIYEKMNLNNNIEISDKIITFLIENYTNEPGVRKLKQILFEIISEINLNILQKQLLDIELPVVVTKEDIQLKYLKERVEVIHKIIHNDPEIGVINGLWANSMGMGGIIPIQCLFHPASKFLDLKLTGMQGDVMKESMNVAKSLAWKLTDKNRQKKLIEDYSNEGLHIHCPEGAIPKDGPSAGTAITTVIYSLFNNLKIDNKVAITGEINLQGKISAIGGLKLKILGGIKAGVNKFLFPKENLKDFIKFKNNNKDPELIKDIEFISVENIDEVLNILF